MKIRILPEVLDCLDELVITLYEKKYFGFKESSKKYVKELLLNIKTTLPIRLHKPAPKHFERYGKDLYYASFKKIAEQLGTHFLQSTSKTKMFFT